MLGLTATVSGQKFCLAELFALRTNISRLKASIFVILSSIGEQRKITYVYHGLFRPIELRIWESRPKSTKGIYFRWSVIVAAAGMGYLGVSA